MRDEGKCNVCQGTGKIDVNMKKGKTRKFDCVTCKGTGQRPAWQPKQYL